MKDLKDKYYGRIYGSDDYDLPLLSSKGKSINNMLSLFIVARKNSTSVAVVYISKNKIYTEDFVNKLFQIFEKIKE